MTARQLGDDAGAEPGPVADADLEPAACVAVGHQRTSSDAVDRRVAADRQPAPAAGGMEPALGRRARRGCRRSRPHRSRARPASSIVDGRRPPLAAERELVERPATAARAVERVHQRVPADAWSARTWSRRNRSRPNGAIRSGVRPGRDPLGERLAAGRDRLEAPRPPAGRDQEAVDAGVAHDRAPVGRDVAQAGPRPEDPHRAEERQEHRDLVGVAPERVERREPRERRLAVELGADQHLAALGLADVAGELGRGDDLGEALLEVVRDEGVERVGPDRQADAGHARPSG